MAFLFCGRSARPVWTEFPNPGHETHPMLSFRRRYSWHTILVPIHQNTIKQINMESSLYMVAVILLIAWLIGFLGYAAGGLVHVLLVLAVIAVLLNITGGNRRRI